MAALHWMAVLLTMFLSAGNGSAAVDQNQLAGIVDEILNRYRPSYETSRFGRSFPMFSVAVSVPYNRETQLYDISKVADTGEQVRDTILRCDVFTGERVVAATVLRWPNVLKQCPEGRVQWPRVLSQCPPQIETWADVQKQEKTSQCRKAVYVGMADHAEYRTLQQFKTLLKNHNEDDLLLFYVLASPCDKRCTSKTNRWNILSSINQILNWRNYAVVFSDVFQPRSGQKIPEKDLRESLQRLASYEGPLGSVGLSNIFRCSGQGGVQCSSCSSNTQVTRYCYSDEPERDPSHNLPSTSVIQPRQGRSGSTSPNSHGDRKQRNNINASEGVSSNVDSNTGGYQGVSGSGVDNGSRGGKGRKRRVRHKKKTNVNKEESLPSSPNGPEVSNTGGVQGTTGRKVLPARRVGRRRVVTKRRGSSNKQKRKPGLKNKGKKGQAPKSEKKMTGEQLQTRGEMRRMNQLQKKGKKQMWG